MLHLCTSIAFPNTESLSLSCSCDDFYHCSCGVHTIPFLSPGASSCIFRPFSSPLNFMFSGLRKVKGNPLLLCSHYQNFSALECINILLSLFEMLYLALPLPLSWFNHKQRPTLVPRPMIAPVSSFLTSVFSSHCGNNINVSTVVKYKWRG